MKFTCSGRTEEPRNAEGRLGSFPEAAFAFVLDDAIYRLRAILRATGPDHAIGTKSEGSGISAITSTLSTHRLHRQRRQRGDVGQGQAEHEKLPKVRGK